MGSTMQSAAAPMRLGRLRVLVLVAALALLGLACVPGGARADDPDPGNLVQDNMHSVALFVADYYGTIPAQLCEWDPGCQMIKAEASRPPTNAEGAAGVFGGLWTLTAEEGGGFMLADPPALLFVAGTLAVAGIGTFVFRSHSAQDRTFTIQIPIATADNPLFWTWSNGADPSIFTTYHDPPDPLPHGYVGSGNWEGTALWQTGEGAADCTMNPPPVASHPGIRTFDWHWNDCWERVPDEPGAYVRVPIFAHGLMIESSAAFAGNLPGTIIPPYATDAGDTSTPPVDPATVEQLIRDGITGGAAPGTTCFFNRGLGGDCHNPMQQYKTLPSC